MKTVSVREAESQLAHLMAEANKGEIIVIKDGENEATLYSARALDPAVDSPELETELLKAANGPFTPYSSAEMKAIGERIIRESRAAKAKE
jgi:antitoxin (DNA-binding transcriptional repressor) of toxin-antitoxin stability system